MPTLTLTPVAATPLTASQVAVGSLTASLAAVSSVSLTEVTAGPPIYVLNSDTYGEAYSFGNTPGSFGFAGTGSPTDIYAPLVVYQRFGVDAPNENVTKTTQAMFTYATYYGPTTDDSAECFSALAALKDTGTAFTQTKPVTGIEGQATVEGGNQLTGGTAAAIGVGSRINASGASSLITDAYAFYAGAVDSTGTITNYSAFYQANSAPGTNNWGVKVKDKIETEQALVLTQSGDDGVFRAEWSGATSSAFVYAQIPDGTDMATVRLQAVAGQTDSLMEFWASGGAGAAATVSTAGAFISTVGLIANNGAGVSQVKMSGDGFHWLVSGLEQTTVGAAGGASGLPATPTKYLKVKDSAGATLVVPAYAAS